MKIKDTLSENVQFVDPDAPLIEVAQLMKDYDCGSIPVAENEKLIGMITDRDIILRCISDGRDPATMTARECMTSGILYCYENDTVEDVLENMGSQAVKRLPVVNKGKRLVGIVSFGDLSAACVDKSCSGEAMEKIREAA